MRRRLLTPLLSIILLGAVLLPASALAGFGAAAHPSGDTAAATTDLASAPSDAAPAAVAVAAHAAGPDHSADRAKDDVPTGAADATDAPDSDAPRSVEPRADATKRDAPSTSTDRPERAIRLGCARVATDRPIGLAVGCRWSAIDDDDLRAYQLWRVVDAPGHGPRRLIATIPAGEARRFLDRDVARGHAYSYAVIAIDKDGEAIGRSRVVTVRFPPRADVLRLACGLVHGDVRGVACRWSAAHHPAAARYVLQRSVDGGAREAIHRAGLDGRRSFLDRDLERGQTIRYSVVVLDKDGTVVGRSRVVTVKLPPRDARPAAPAAGA